jgi:signal transduction histidine kinase
MRRSSVRTRLTVQYAGLFLLSGTLLLVLNYALARRSINVSPEALQDRIASRLGHPIPAAPEQPPDSSAAQIIFAAREELVGETLRQLMVQSLLALGVMTVISSALGWVVAGRVLRPIAEMTEHARRIGETNLHERIDLRGPHDELKELADTFDGLLARLDGAFDIQRRFAADASHELRTPLSIIRTELDVGLQDPNASVEELREMGEAIRVAADRSELLIDRLLALARSDAGVRERQPIDLHRVVGEAVTASGPHATAAGIHLRGQRKAAMVSGDLTLMRVLVTNLIDNGIRYNRPGGWVEASTFATDAGAVLRVANSGPVLQEEQLDSLFDPFTRMTPQRTGSDRGAGLGLSIVRAVAKAHAAVIEALAPETGGLEIRITFPCSEP